MASPSFFVHYNWYDPDTSGTGRCTIYDMSAPTCIEDVVKVEDCIKELQGKPNRIIVVTNWLEWAKPADVAQ